MKPRNPIRLKWKICFVVMGLIGLILLFLWLFELIYRPSVYSDAREGAVVEAERAAERAIESSFEDKAAFANELSRIAAEYDVALVVLEEDGTKYKGGTDLACTVLAQTADSLKALASRAEEEGGAYTEKFSLLERGVEWASEEDEAYSVLYVRLPEYEGVRLVAAETIVAPLGNRIEPAMILQSAVLSAVFVMLAAIATLVMSQMIAKPMEKVNQTAKELALGKSDLTFEAQGYREIEELRDSLNYAAKEIAESERYRKELIANVSHDLKTPLALIKGYTEMMRDLPGEGTAENLQVVIDETERLTGLVNDLLEVSRLQSGMKLEPEPFVINELVEEIVARVAAFLKGKIEIAYEEDGRYQVNADRKKIAQVIYNLISNAVNYAGEDGKIWIKVCAHGYNVRVEVKDNGEGIDVEILPRIWDRYYKSEKAHKRAVMGTGLGLSIVKQVIALHPGGVYGVQTSRGKGSNFYFELPVIHT